ncbi:M1 family metallopeptidase [Paenibacillus sabinae]|uniref:Peptidase m1 membrane alanine aminopeptidase n=1 Tax=Paenibacillus sabinae T27 TaxID=1268072 RepID=X4ZRD0_9BACL|nr:M1 family metallopeptidase [Paenibacillus sabinae]AHV95038.1 peptidase m1 membrane alanine aminopeptidase [Paenibacillus sabinae T27]
MKRRFRTTYLFAALTALCLLGGGIWALSGSSPVSRYAAAPETAKSPASPRQEQAGKPAMPVPPAASSAPALSRRVAEYHISVQLDPGTSTLTAAETVTWTHPGKNPVSDLYFHLYPNAFASDSTTFMKESGGKLRSDSMPQDGFGSITLTDVRTTDGVSLMHRMQYVQPDDGNPDDKTLIKIHLPQPVNGGESVTVKLRYEVRLPKIFARMGESGDFIMAGQWFPKLSVYEPAEARGRGEEGWNLHQYHGTSEFYSDFGIYSVAISVPANYTVGATGFPVKSPRIAGGRKIYQFYADDVHDFAWAASPDFVYAEKAYSSANVPGVRIKLYLDPLHKNLAERYFQAAEAALNAFSKWYGPYPYTTLSIVVPPKAGNGAGGMEYPTLITAFGAESGSADTSLERTVIHEIGHQFFYGMVASNEFEEAWLDESFTSYAEDRLMQKEYGIAPNLPLQANLVTKPMPLTLDTWKYGNANVYTQNVYIRGKLVLKDIEQQVGAKAMDTIMSSYARKYRFHHPGTADFQKIVEKVTKKSWQDYFDRYVYGGGAPDFTVEDITVSKSKKGGYESLTTVANKGSLYTGVSIKFTFANGSTLHKIWDGEGGKASFRLSSAAPLVSAEVDPGHEVLLENKHINNFRKAALPAAAVSRWTLSLTNAIETVLGIFVW